MRLIQPDVYGNHLGFGAALSRRTAADDSRYLMGSDVDSSNGAILRVRNKHIAMRVDGNTLGPIESRIFRRPSVA